MVQKLIIFFFLLCSCSLSGQEESYQRFKAGVIAGFNASQIDGDDAVGFTKLGLVAGLRAVTIITEKIDVSLELLYSQRGSRSELFNSTNTLIPFKIQLNYIEIPVIFNFGDWLSDDEEYYRLNFHGGFSYGNLFSFKVEDETGNLQQISETFNKHDVSWLAGVTYFVNKHLGVTFRYSRSINSLRKPINNIPGQRMMIGYFFTLRAVYMI